MRKTGFRFIAVSETESTSLSILVSVALHALVVLAALQTPLRQIVIPTSATYSPTRVNIHLVGPVAAPASAAPLSDEAIAQTTPSPKTPASATKDKIPVEKTNPSSAVGGAGTGTSARTGPGGNGDSDLKEAGVFQSAVPVYPKAALNQDWAGTVVVDVTLDAVGNPTRFEVVRSTGHEILDQAFIRTLKTGYRYTPPKRGNTPVEGKIRVTYTFELDK
jgi:protein TonB